VVPLSKTSKVLQRWRQISVLLDDRRSIDLGVEFWSMNKVQKICSTFARCNGDCIKVALNLSVLCQSNHGENPSYFTALIFDPKIGLAVSPRIFGNSASPLSLAS
jgi:hypothetical protein